MIRILRLCCALIVGLVLPLTAVAQDLSNLPDLSDLPSQRAEPSDFTIRANDNIAGEEEFTTDLQDFVDAEKGFMAPLDPLIIRLGVAAGATCQTGCDPVSQAGDCGDVVWDLTKYEFMNPNLCTATPFVDLVDVPAPDSVNPSLWRNAVLNTFHGVFEVVPKAIFQIRGYDLANMSAIQGDTGWIIIDPLTTEETAAAALQNLNTAYESFYDVPPPHQGKVSAVIFTHSHVDHFGGVNGLFDSDTDRDAAVIYAPEGFFDEAVSENVIAGNAMGRRASYMYGSLLRRGERGQVDGGLGKTTPVGTTGIAQPDCVIGKGAWSDGCVDGSVAWQQGAGEMQEIVIGEVDGVEVHFQNVPGSEAPAEMLFYFPDHLALCASEDVTHTFHNVLTLRGANVRDALLWAKYLDKTLDYFGQATVVFASHHWPTWNDGDYSVAYLIEQQRDLYRYIHDQSVRLINHGYTIQEVGEMVELPDSLGKHWFNRGYYGTVNHNAKAVYQRYMGWFDANPASLHQLPPADAAGAYVRYMGGAEAILEKARDDYEAGHYRWVAMVLNHVVFSSPEPSHLPIRGTKIYDPIREARRLLADTYDQLGYQAESGPWRNFYLTGAMEIRNGVLPLPAVKTFTRDTVEAMNLEMIFDFIAVHVNGPEAGEFDYTFNIDFTDSSVAGMTEDSRLFLKNGVLNFDVGSLAATPTATLQMDRDTLNDIIMGEQTFDADGHIVGVAVVDGSGGQPEVDDFWGVMDTFEFWFNIVTPNPFPE